MSVLSSSMDSYTDSKISEITTGRLNFPAAPGKTPPTCQTNVADYISAAVAPYVSKQLISCEALLNIGRIASSLPGALTDFFGFECPLGVSQPSADFLVCAKARQGGREVLSNRRLGRNLPAFFQAHPTWQRIQSFANEWSDPQSPLFDHIHNMWIEFDVEGMPPPVPVPSVFIGADNMQPLERTIDDETMPSHCEWLTEVALPVLLGGTLEQAQRRQIARCFNFLPSGARIFQVGLMLARNSSTTRLCVRGLSGTQITDYLRGLDYDTASGELQRLVDVLAPLVDRIDLDLDVADRVLPKIGLECYLPMNPGIIRRYLDHLAVCGLATSVKAEALESWQGLAHERLTPEIWPHDLLALSSFMGGRVHSVFARWLHHVKIVFEPGLRLQAKAYLAVYHDWLAPGSLKALLRMAQSGALEHQG